MFKNFLTLQLPHLHYLCVYLSIFVTLNKNSIYMNDQKVIELITL